MSDTLDSSTIKTTHFKGSGDGAGDLRELKDRMRDSGLFFFFFSLLRSSGEKKRREERPVGREGVISRLITQKHKAHEVCWCAKMS